MNERNGDEASFAVLDRKSQFDDVPIRRGHVRNGDVIPRPAGFLDAERHERDAQELVANHFALHAVLSLNCPGGGGNRLDSVNELVIESLMSFREPRMRIVIRRDADQEDRITHEVPGGIVDLELSSIGQDHTIRIERPCPIAFLQFGPVDHSCVLGIGIHWVS
jgi:hypothetical protein